MNSVQPRHRHHPLANDELRGPRRASYRRIIEVSAAQRVGTPDEKLELLVHW
jgi:hypothetical protein